MLLVSGSDFVVLVQLRCTSGWSTPRKPKDEHRCSWRQAQLGWTTSISKQEISSRCGSPNQTTPKIQLLTYSTYASQCPKGLAANVVYFPEKHVLWRPERLSMNFFLIPTQADYLPSPTPSKEIIIYEANAGNFLKIKYVTSIFSKFCHLSFYFFVLALFGLPNLHNEYPNQMLPSRFLENHQREGEKACKQQGCG